MINKVAILIDGGFFVRRFRKNNSKSPQIKDINKLTVDLISDIQKKTGAHSTDVLFRSFYYDCRPFGNIKTDPNGKSIDFGKTPQFKAAKKFHEDLKTTDGFAVRLGDLSFDGWKINTSTTPHTYIPDVKQKSVDIKIGLDIAWMSSKKTIDKIILVAGDSDFVPAMKFSRREGVLVYLHCMKQKMIKKELKEHADFII